MSARLSRTAAHRPLRWIKFAAGIFAGSLALAAAAPACRLALVVLSGPFAEVEAPLRLLPAAGLVAFVLVSWTRLVADAAFDRHAPRWLTAALVGAALIASMAPGVFAPPSQRRVATHEVASSLRTATILAKRGLGGGESAAAIRARLVDGLTAPAYFDRFFRRVPVSVVVIEGSDAPVLEARPGDPPGTLYLAITAAGDAGWLTASVLDGDRISILREGGPLVVGVVACDATENGGASC